MVRAKFRVDSVTHNAPQGGKKTVTIQMFPVYGNSEENKKFWQYTPGGSIQLQTVNADAAAQFEPGDEFYIDFTKAE